MIIFMQLMILVSALKYLIVHMTKDAQSFSLTIICCLRYLQHSTRIHRFMPQGHICKNKMVQKGHHHIF